MPLVNFFFNWNIYLGIQEHVPGVLCCIQSENRFCLFSTLTKNMNLIFLIDDEFF